MTRAEAARALGVSINSFERHVQPEREGALHVRCTSGGGGIRTLGGP
jgi:hypothetical protein